jgi:hypothetical protein
MAMKMQKSADSRQDTGDRPPLCPVRCILAAVAVAVLVTAWCGGAFAVSRILTFSDLPYAETPLPSDYGTDDEISLLWSTEGQSSSLIVSTGQSPFPDHSPDGTNRFLSARGTSVIRFDPTVRLVRVFVRDNEPDFISESASAVTLRGELKDVPVFSAFVDFVPASRSGVWIEVNGPGSIDTLKFISHDDLTKRYQIDDLEFEVYSETEIIVLAGPNQAVLEGTTVTLDGSRSLNAHSFSWSQVKTGSEPTVALTSPTHSVTQFRAPDVATVTVLTFMLTASGPLGMDSDLVEITVHIASAPRTPPQGLTLLPNEAQGRLNGIIEWSAHPDATRYVVYRAEENPGNHYVNLAASISTPRCADEWLEEGMIYFYKVAAVNSFGEGPACEPIGFVARRNLAFDSDALPLAKVRNPTGSGLRDIECIRDGITDESYDSYHGAVKESEDWYGYLFDRPHYFDTIVYYEGRNFYDGGWWTTLTVQVTTDGTTWTNVERLAMTPPYNFADSREGRVHYSRFLLTFARCRGNGIRIYGEPGGIADFTSIAELEVYGDQAPNIVVADAGLDIRADEGTLITLHGENSLNAESYLWEQVLLGDEPVVLLSEANTPNPTFTVQDISRNVMLTFRLTVTGFHGPVSDTVQVTVVNKEGPGATEGLSAVGGDRRVELAWLPNPDATSHKILRNTVSGGGGTVAAEGITATAYVDRSPILRPYKTYYYQVVGVNNYGEGPGSNIAPATPVENFAMYPDAIPIAMVTEPTGSGQRDLDIIRNGIYDEKGYDSYDGPNPADKDWYGYLWRDPLYPDKVVYTMGRNYLDGGWWTSLTIEYTTDGETWAEAQNVVITPPYNFSNEPAARPDYSRYVLTFDSVRASGLRIAGTPGGFAQFTSIVELEVYGLDAPVAGRREIEPLFYIAGDVVTVTLALEIHEPPAPESLTLIEEIPPGASVLSAIGAASITANEISWEFGPGEVTDTELTYTIALPADFAGRLPFHGWLAYADITDQRIRGQDALYPKPAPPKNLRLEMTLGAHLRWSPALDDAVAGYRVYRSADGGDYEDISGLIADARFDDFSVLPGISYRYQVTAENVLGVESALTESPDVGPASVVMTQWQCEDYNYGQGLFPGGQGRQGVPADASNDLSGDKDYFFHDTAAGNVYRPADAVDIRESTDGGYFVADVRQGDWWRFSFDVPRAGYVKIADLRAASSGEATYEFFWDETAVGDFSFHTGGNAEWQTHSMDVPAFFSQPGVHTLRIHVVSGVSNMDWFGIGFDWPAPAVETIFSEDFDGYTTSEEVVSAGGWTIVNGGGDPNGAWQLWNTSGQPLANGEPGPDFPGFSAGYMVTNGDFAPNIELDEQLISPEINCARSTCVSVRFTSAMNIYQQDTDGDLQTTDFDIRFFDEESQSWSDWVNLLSRDRTDGDHFSAIPQWFDVSSLADGRKVKFRWRFHNTRYDYWWAVDDVRVTGEKAPPRIFSATLTPEGSVELSWESFASGSYTVEHTGDPASGDWLAVPGTQWPIAQTTWRDDNLSGVSFRFYRVRSE